MSASAAHFNGHSSAPALRNAIKKYGDGYLQRIEILES